MNRPESKKLIISYILICSIFVLCIVGVYFFKFHGRLSDLPADWGSFGDFVGGVINPFFSFLAFIAILYSIRQQSDLLIIEKKRNEKSDLIKAIDSVNSKVLHPSGFSKDVNENTIDLFNQLYILFCFLQKLEIMDSGKIHILLYYKYVQKGNIAFLEESGFRNNSKKFSQAEIFVKMADFFNENELG